MEAGEIMPSNPNELPADFEFPEELPADFFAAQPGELGANVAYPPDVVPQDQAPPLSWWDAVFPRHTGVIDGPPETQWWEAMFPRSSARADLPAWHPRAMQGAAFDVSDLAGRAYESMWRPEGETYLDALGRTGPHPSETGAKRFTSTVLRDAANLPIVAASAAAPYAVPALLGAAARAVPAAANAARPLVAAGMVANQAAPKTVQALGRGAVTGAGIGSTLAAVRQAENYGAERPISAEEVGWDVGLGSLIGTGTAALAPIGRRLIA